MESSIKLSPKLQNLANSCIIVSMNKTEALHKGINARLLPTTTRADRYHTADTLAVFYESLKAQGYAYNDSPTAPGGKIMDFVSGGKGLNPGNPDDVESLLRHKPSIMAVGAFAADRMVGLALATNASREVLNRYNSFTGRFGNTVARINVPPLEYTESNDMLPSVPIMIESYAFEFSPDMPFAMNALLREVVRQRGNRVLYAPQRYDNHTNYQEYIKDIEWYSALGENGFGLGNSKYPHISVENTNGSVSRSILMRRKPSSESAQSDLMRKIIESSTLNGIA